MNGALTNKFGSLRWSSLLVATVALLAAFLRLYALELVSITNDEGYHGYAMWYIATLDFENWPLSGYPSVGIRNSALFMYLLAIPYFFVFHSLSGVVFVAGLNLLALFLTWRLTRERFGTPAAYIATLLFAFSPWSVLYARQMWPPSCLAVVTLWFIGIALRWLEEGGDHRLFGLVVLGFVIPQFHFSGFCAPVWLCVVLLLGRKRLRASLLLTAAVVGVATWSPWIYLQHSSHWLDLRQALRAAKGTAGVLDTLTQTLGHYQSLLHSGNFEFWFATTTDNLPEYFPAWLRLVLPATGTVLVVVFACSLIGACWKPADRSLWLLVFWSLLPILMLLLLRPKSQPHYVLIGFPVPFILMGAWCGRVTAWDRLWPRVAVIAPLLLVSVAHVVFLYGWYGYVNDDRPTGAGQYQLSYRQRRDVVATILEDSARKHVRMSGPVSGRYPAYDFVYTFEQFRQGFHALPVDQSRIYWIEDERFDHGLQGQDWMHKKQQRIGRSLQEYRNLSPNWEIEHHWKTGPAHVYRLRRSP